MSELRVAETITIDAPHDTVRQQFADVAHHAAVGVHRGVVFEVLEDATDRCRYRQTTRVGPMRLRQELEMPRTDSGPLVNTITKGQFAGGSISFEIEPYETDTSRVVATLVAPLGMVERLLAPVLRQSVKRALAGALAEDKADIESGRYGDSRSG